MRESRSTAGTGHAPGASSAVSSAGSAPAVGKRTAVEAIQSTGAARAGAAVQRKAPGDPPGPGRGPPAGKVAQSHSFAVPQIPPLAPIPDAVNRNQVINQTYHVIDAAMTGYLGDPLVANWYTYGQHASREAGTEIRALQE